MTVMLVKVDITPDMAGTWLDGHFGWHNAYRVVQTAETFGFTVPEEYRDAMDNYRVNGDRLDFEMSDEQWLAIYGQGELSDMATDFLQERAPEGYVFVWDMGELSLMTEEEGFYF
ncbi:hypothetical protein ACFWOT_09095 [Streptomyces sp. NPDC058440]|uniref:hypothetical protein n=1 Tax=Streptomyces sp. NPDC058440 TaxID=3346501 RepID=UPI003669BADC